MCGAACTEALPSGPFSIYFAPSRSTDRPVPPLPKLVQSARPLLMLAAILSAAAISGCKSRGEEIDTKGSPERIHQDANRDLANGNFPGAIQRLELLEARFPFSDPARQAQIDLIYAYYRNRETESAIDQADQFIRENPTHPRVDYAYYIKGLVYFESGANALERLFRADVTKRPPQEARKSFQAFQTLVQQFPKSPYAADARQRMVYLRNRLADYEVHVARYYMKRGAYVGALNRARGLIETYDGAPAALEALDIGAKAYRQLGMDDLAQVVEGIRAGNESPDLVNPMAAMAGLTTGSTGAGSRMGEIDSGLGFLFGVGYHYNDHLQFGSTFTFDQKDYEAEVVGDTPGESFTAKGSLDTMSLMVDVAYNFLTGPLTPFVAGSVGWSWVDTNIATEPPSVGCWWHPWYGYICTSWQDTRTLDGLAYELGVGMRYDFGERFAADGSYRIRWVDFENAVDSPSFDGLQLNLIWKF